MYYNKRDGQGSTSLDKKNTPEAMPRAIGKPLARAVSHKKYYIKSLSNAMSFLNNIALYPPTYFLS